MITKSSFKIGLALVFALLVVLFPWEGVRSLGFADRQVYLEYVSYGINRLDYVDFDGLASYIVNESLWHLLLKSYTLQQVFDVETLFQVLSFFSLAIFSVFLVKRFHPASLLFLLNPLVLDFVLSQYRSALALALIGLAVMVRKRYLSLGLVSMVPFIHTASLLFIGFIWGAAGLARLLQENKVSWRTAVLLACASGAIVALVTGPFRETILTVLNDRRAIYNAETASTLLYSSFWMMLLCLMISQKRAYFENPMNLYSVAILSLVTVNYFIAGYSTRFLAASFPVLISSILSLPRYLRIMTISAFILYMLVQWLFWSGARVYLF